MNEKQKMCFKCLTNKNILDYNIINLENNMACVFYKSFAYKKPCLVVEKNSRTVIIRNMNDFKNNNLKLELEG